MNLRKNQRGLSGWGWLFVLIVIGFSAVVGMKLFPVYMESFKVDNALKGLSQESDLMKGPVSELRKRFLRRMEIEDVDRFTEANIKDHLTLERKNNASTVVMKYQAKAPLFSNLSVIADFDKRFTSQ